MKRKLPIKKVPAELHVLRFPAATERRIGPHCLNCSLPLSVLQPDLDSPERLLGVCEQCKGWFLIDLIPDRREGLLWRLPDTETIRRLSLEGSSDPASGESDRRDL
jgi:hypothetical protein